MVTIIPFQALRPEAQHAKQVASPPYDVLTTKEAKTEAQGNPISFLHITKSEIDLPDNTDAHSGKVYEKAKQNLNAFISRKTLFTETKPCYYIYQLTMGNNSQTGLVCCSSIEDYENNFIKKHEHTRPEKEEDRINHIKATCAQTGNVFLTYKSVTEINTLLDEWKKKSPVYNFTANDKIQHAVWLISDEKVINNITRLFKTKVPCTYIADGHHRAASAAKVRTYFAGSSKAANYFLTTLFPSDQVNIMAYNRVVKDLNGLSIEKLFKRIEEKFSIDKVDEPFSPSKPHTFGMYLNKQWYKLETYQNTYSHDPIGILDVTILHNNLLEPVLGIQDERSDKRIDFIGGKRGLKELEKKVDSGEFAAGFSFYPVTIQQLLDVADSGNVMPPKSTWFEPKLRDGLLTHQIDCED